MSGDAASTGDLRRRCIEAGWERIVAPAHGFSVAALRDVEAVVEAVVPLVEADVAGRIAGWYDEQARRHGHRRVENCEYHDRSAEIRSGVWKGEADG